MFIGGHLGTDYEGAWTYVDIAAPRVLGKTWGSIPDPYQSIYRSLIQGERATGYGVALFGKCSGSSLLNTDGFLITAG